MTYLVFDINIHLIPYMAKKSIGAKSVLILIRYWVFTTLTWPNMMVTARVSVYHWVFWFFVDKDQRFYINNCKNLSTCTLYTVLQVGKFEVNLKRNNRAHQHSMTSDPNKVWPGGILPYVIDQRLSKDARLSSEW